MKIKFDKVLVRVSELTTTEVVCAPWETAILQAMYGEDARVTGSETVKREVPNAQDEFARLAIRYGPRHADTPTVAAVYGNFGPGVAALDAAIRRTIKGGPAVEEVDAAEVEAARVAARNAQLEAAAEAATKPANPELVPPVVPEVVKDPVTGEPAQVVPGAEARTEPQLI